MQYPIDRHVKNGHQLSLPEVLFSVLIFPEGKRIIGTHLLLKYMERYSWKEKLLNIKWLNTNEKIACKKVTYKLYGKAKRRKYHKRSRKGTDKYCNSSL
jgi:hypothetical protein